MSNVSRCIAALVSPGVVAPLLWMLTCRTQYMFTMGAVHLQVKCCR
jgi:hypothetical protein